MQKRAETVESNDPPIFDGASPVVQHVVTRTWFETNYTVIIICLSVVVVVLVLLIIWLYMRSNKPETPMLCQRPPETQPKIDDHQQLANTTNVDDLKEKLRQRRATPPPEQPPQASTVEKEADDAAEALLQKANE